MTNAAQAGKWMARSAEVTPRRGRRWFVVLPPGKARARQSDAGVALAAGGYADMGTAASHGHTNTRPREIEMDPRQQFDAALKTEAHLFLMSRTRDSS